MRECQSQTTPVTADNGHQSRFDCELDWRLFCKYIHAWTMYLDTRSKSVHSSVEEMSNYLYSARAVFVKFSLGGSEFRLAMTDRATIAGMYRLQNFLGGSATSCGGRGVKPPDPPVKYSPEQCAHEALCGL